jgi:hypothetical protein
MVLIQFRYDRVGFPFYRMVKDTTQTKWFLLFYGGGSRSGSKTRVFDRNTNAFKFKPIQEIITFIGLVISEDLQIFDR